MSKKRPEHFLKKDEVVEKIQEKDPNFNPLKKAKKSDILALANEIDVISDKQLADSVEPKYKVIKLYLRSILKNVNDEQRIEDYVLCHSKLFIRATRLQNLAVHRFLGVPGGSLCAKKCDPRFNSSLYNEEHPASDLYHRIYDGIHSEYLRQVYLP